MLEKRGIDDADLSFSTFEAVVCIIQSGKWSHFDGIHLIEDDSIPIKSYWLNVIQSDIEVNQPFSSSYKNSNGNKAFHPPPDPNLLENMYKARLPPAPNLMDSFSYSRPLPAPNLRNKLYSTLINHVHQPSPTHRMKIRAVNKTTEEKYCVVHMQEETYWAKLLCLDYSTIKLRRGLFPLLRISVIPSHF